MNKILIFCCLVIALGSCKPKNPLIGSWKIVRISYTPSSRATPESHALGEQLLARSTSALQNSTFALYEEEKCSFFSTKTPFRQGNWVVENSILSLFLGPMTSPYEFDIGDIDDQLMVLTLLDNSTTNGEITLICQKSKQYQLDDIDLLAPDQNEWRKKPEKKETKAQIRTRVLTHLDYMINYFRCVEKNKQTYFETGLVSSPFTFYAHGLGLSKESTLSRRWQESFYDKSDAKVGIDELRSAMRTIKKFPKAETFSKEYLLAFEQMRPYFED
ncbi:hypothetical protein [Arundinibacter roseus]|uniref:Uncharacterized protein n=1 Tax=Arundinibacter roseus TaxID=2070510 RepID=A0A4R4K9Z5_9BACT|nr:hypothetical protein [Arundinibacter roseus]TDB64608.1 hypothetical protein EZE20_13130 [Arundinibacter roseus]